MTQLAHARALHLLADTGIDPDTARYIMKRLYDLGFTARARDIDPGVDPPGDAAAMHPAKAARQAARADVIRSIRDEVAAARESRAAELAAQIAADQTRRVEEDRARARALAVARVLAAMPDPDREEAPQPA